MDKRKYHIKRHKFIFRILRPCVHLIWRLKFNLEAVPAPQLKPPFLVLSNHNTDLDPFSLALSFPGQHMYFVSSEHIFAKKSIARFLIWVVDPIVRLKGSIAASTAKEILRRLRRGYNVGFFAEGNRSFNGLTGFILPSTGKLVKAAGVPLITYHFTGGYFTNPRWSYTLRRGKLRGACVNVYTKEDLAKMSVDEINAALRNDLFEDAYARQQREHIRYKGKRLAEGMETALFICPVCGRADSLKTRGDRFFCECGMEGRYTEEGFLTGAPFTTITEWDAWQTAELAKRVVRERNEALFGDDGISFSHIGKTHRREKLPCDTLRAFRDKLCCGELCFPYDKIVAFNIFGRSNLVFTTTGDDHYEIRFPKRRCGWKYVKAYEIYKQLAENAAEPELSQNDASPLKAASDK